jgi:hypothetical protein
MRYDGAMRNLFFATLRGLGLVACGSDTTTMGDLSAAAQDMASHGDLASSTMCVDAGPKAFGDACTTDCECVTGMCRMFQMGAVHKCTQPCSVGCPSPPSTGMCTNNGCCKF